MIEHIADHENRAVELIPLVHELRPGRKGLVQALGAAAQVAEDQFYASYMSRTFELASGYGLELWGWLAGVPRGGLPDEWFKRLIRVAMYAKYSQGTTDDTIKLWQLATGGYVEFTRYPHRCIVLTAWVEDWLPEDYARRAAAVVRRGCPIGSVVLFEALYSNYLGDGDVRTTAPLPTHPPSGALGAKVW